MNIEEFRKTLPIFDFKDEIITKVRDEIFTIITGDTGSGKSTQLPQYLLDCPEFKDSLLKARSEYYANPDAQKIKFQNKGFELEDRSSSQDLKIVVTQPRRMAAISMAKRIAFERSQNLGEEVGYSIRFDNHAKTNTQLRYVTDGILVRECLQDADLTQYDVVILDEAHERSLYTDVLFALVKGAAQRRKGSLKVIITSATLNVGMFKAYFNQQTFVKVNGKAYPVEMKFAEHNLNPSKRNQDAVNAALRMHLHEVAGDILIFLPGSEDCEYCRKLCYERLEEILNAGQTVPGVILYTLYGSQSSEDQSLVFQKQDADTRKIIFCTNIAETSLTIDNIGFVVDSGYVKQKVYNQRTGMDSLVIQPISKTQAIQRMGRAGRTQEGKCYRLYTKQFYESMQEHSMAEIMRVNLSSVVLLLKSMRIHDIIRFQFMEQPSQESILQALRQLYLLAAIDEDGAITPLGQEMSKYPLEPSYAKALITSKLLDCSNEMATIVAILSTESIWQRITRVDVDGYQRLIDTQAKHADSNGDHCTLLKVFQEWKSASFIEQFAKENLLNLRALKQSDNIRSQLQKLVEASSRRKLLTYYENDHIYTYYKKQRKMKSTEAVKLALCSGFYYNTARKMHSTEDSYLMIYPEGTVVDMDSSSVYSIVQSYPATVIFTELGGTQMVRGIMRLVSDIDIEWVKNYIPNMVKVDLFRLAKIEFEQKSREIVLERRLLKQAETEKLTQAEEKQKEIKHKEYLQRYEQRKRVRLE